MGGVIYRLRYRNALKSPYFGSSDKSGAFRVKFECCFWRIFALRWQVLVFL